MEMLLSAENRFELINEQMSITNALLEKSGRCYRHHEDPILDVGSCQYSSCDAGAV